MADELARRAREGIEAFSRGELEKAIEGFSDDIVWEVAGDMTPEPAVYEGHDGVREFWAQWREPFEGFTLEILECRSVGDDRVLVVTRAHGVGAGSGVSVTSPEFAQLFEYRGEKAIRVRLAATREAALAEG